MFTAHVGQLLAVRCGDPTSSARPAEGRCPFRQGDSSLRDPLYRSRMPDTLRSQGAGPTGQTPSPSPDGRSLAVAGVWHPAPGPLRDSFIASRALVVRQPPESKSVGHCFCVLTGTASSLSPPQQQLFPSGTAGPRSSCEGVLWNPLEGACGRWEDGMVPPVLPESWRGSVAVPPDCDRGPRALLATSSSACSSRPCVTARVRPQRGRFPSSPGFGRSRRRL